MIEGKFIGLKQRPRDSYELRTVHGASEHVPIGKLTWEVTFEVDDKFIEQLEAFYGQEAIIKLKGE